MRDLKWSLAEIIDLILEHDLASEVIKELETNRPDDVTLAKARLKLKRAIRNKYPDFKFVTDLALGDLNQLAKALNISA